MAYNLTAEFWSFAKRHNSTKRPSTAAAATINYALKESTSILAPTIEVHDNRVVAYNYCYLSAFSRRYWIRDKRCIAKDTYELDLEVDVPGSWGPLTYGQNVMAQMSAAYYDDELDDTRIVAVDEHVQFVTAALDVFPTNYEIMPMISLVTGASGYFGGCDVFYDLYNVGNVLSIIDKLMDPDLWKSVVDSVLNSNPLSIINGIWSVPYNVTNCHYTDAESRALQLGFINAETISGSLLKGPFVRRHLQNVTLPTPTNTDFRFCDRFVKYYVNIPFVGTCVIPTTLAKYQRNLRCEYSADCVSGMFSISLYCGGVCLGNWSTNLKSELSLVAQTSQAAASISGGIKGAAMVASGVSLAGGAQGALIGAVAGAAVGAFKGAASTPDIEFVSSASGSLAPAARNTRQLEVFMYEGEENTDPATFAATVGRPTQKIIQLAANMGYVQTANASVSFTGLKPEIDAFNTLLNGGLYYE